MDITLIVVLWDNPGFGGAKRQFIDTMSDLEIAHFNDRASSIGIHPGPNVPVGSIETISFFEDVDFKGKELVLGAGIHANLDVLGFNDKISSLRFNRNLVKQQGLWIDGILAEPLGSAPPAAIISSIPLVIHLYEDSIGGVDQADIENNLRLAKHITLVEPTSDIGRYYGKEWDNVASTLLVEKGPQFDHHVVRLYSEPQPDGARPGNGQEIGGWHDFSTKGFGYYLLDSYRFQDVTSAVGIVQLNIGSIAVVDAAKVGLS